MLKIHKIISFLFGDCCNAEDAPHGIREPNVLKRRRRDRHGREVCSAGFFRREQLLDVEPLARLKNLWCHAAKFCVARKYPCSGESQGP